MGIAAQLGRVTHLWEGDPEIGEEVVQRGPVTQYGFRLQGRGEDPDTILQDLFETAAGWHRSPFTDFAAAKSEFGSAPRVRTRARHPGERSGRRAWWCGSASAPSGVARRARRCRHGPYQLQRCVAGDADWRGGSHCASMVTEQRAESDRGHRLTALAAFERNE